MDCRGSCAQRGTQGLFDRVGLRIRKRTTCSSPTPPSWGLAATTVEVRRHGQAVRGGELHEGSSRRHGLLYRAWRRQALSEGCTTAAQGSKQFCKAHGGFKRFEDEGCSKHAVGSTRFCKAHGGGKRCQHKGCPKAAATGGTQHCAAHGGGKRCRQDNCFMPVARVAGSTLCTQCLRDTPPGA